MVLFSIASATLLQRQFSRIAKCKLSFCNLLQEFAQILHEFANTKHMLNLFLLKSSDLEIKCPMLLSENNKKKFDERSKPVFCLSWLHYSLLLHFVFSKYVCIVLYIEGWKYILIISWKNTNKKGVSGNFNKNHPGSTAWPLCQRASKFLKIVNVGKWQHEFLDLAKISTYFCWLILLSSSIYFFLKISFYLTNLPRS